jgi:hypothetical protein
MGWVASTSVHAIHVCICALSDRLGVLVPDSERDDNSIEEREGSVCESVRCIPVPVA